MVEHLQEMHQLEVNRQEVRRQTVLAFHLRLSKH